MDRPSLQAWIDGYEAAWRTAGTEPLRTLFTDDASYLPSPYEEPLRGLERSGASGRTPATARTMRSR
jgi:hypothetical protein